MFSFRHMGGVVLADTAVIVVGFLQRSIWRTKLALSVLQLSAKWARIDEIDHAIVRS